MLQREIAEMLRAPEGAYFAPRTNALLALETMVDTVGLRNVLYALEMICIYKARHIEENWQESGKSWDKAAKRIKVFASGLHQTPLDV